MEHRARKRFGQNFLHDPLVIDRIHAAIDARPGERLVEIGPGQGAITQGLLTRAGALDVIELDRDLIEPLRQRLGGLGELRIHNADALDFDLRTLADSEGTLRLVGNLPYNISTPLLFHFLDQLDALQDMHLMLQKEVVERIAAEPGDKTYGRLSVMIQSRCAAASLFRIGPGAFKPAPKVESAFLRLRPLRPLPHPIDDPRLHGRIVAAAFGQRRKTLRNSLSGVVDLDIIEAAGIDPKRRAEELDVASYTRLANLAASATAD
ncbi:16S rRNA (adenine(1518)-N(6)/adenine(1519)-N(6))-dimethyltransferase RsmA [Allochromatium vinosum]|uniref:Ribosomal RNA small subunit methyltransferase A n=1 Tax=Allochromatium vinosum (strain ATCC 17899 / DSM 180 / NBRC 103801 / NCIMB 10441 / D) TaxID=572477 RepID=D3RTK9_ALLVD|nr:16S rRNA (adenine(1518)-N(6)/adenine(1519)-N(6))-dimethyltransferase RsmA [Allochromatium vinosum]ADC62518.1 dimethyladenosine transferase [Allochromatium vinosum DSM 180]